MSWWKTCSSAISSRAKTSASRRFCWRRRTRPAWTGNSWPGGADGDRVRQEEQTARRIGVTGVPCFIVAGKHAVSGAQEPAVLVNMFDLAMGEVRAPAHAAEGAAADD